MYLFTSLSIVIKNDDVIKKAKAALEEEQKQEAQAALDLATQQEADVEKPVCIKFKPYATSDGDCQHVSKPKHTGCTSI